MRKLLSLPLLLLVLLVGACSDSTGPGEENITGTYTLKTVGGAALPALVDQEGGASVHVTAGSLRLNDDLTFSGSISLRFTQGGSVTNHTEPLAGTYQRNNTALQLSFNDGNTETASVSGKTLTLTTEGIVFVFER